MTRAVIGLGSNIDPEENLPAAMHRLLTRPDMCVLATSPSYRSVAAERPNQPDYHNAAALLSTRLTPDALKDVLRQIETSLGRVRTEDKFAPRTIDLDLLLYEGFEGDVGGTLVPDPGLGEWAHLAVPAAAVAPDWEYGEASRPLRVVAADLASESLEEVMSTEIARMDSTSRYAPEGRMEAVEDEVYDAGFEGNVRDMLLQLGEDPAREGLARTPLRVAKAMDYLTSGYTASLDQVVNNAIFESDADEMVLVKDIEFYSLCEHHMLPFFGRAHVAYLPDGRVIGLSKVARLVDLFSRRLQIQERLTNQIADAIMDVLDPHGVAVVMEGSHFCMMMRGVQKQGSSMVTSSMRGGFKTNQSTRSEFMELISD